MDYTARAVCKLAEILKRSVSIAAVEDLPRLQQHQFSEGTSPVTPDAVVMGLKCLFEQTLQRAFLTSPVGANIEYQLSNKFLVTKHSLI